MDSSQSSITLICAGGSVPCKDPLVDPIPAIILDQCEDPANPGTIKFPCKATFPKGADLTSVCIGAFVVQCNGGHKEKRFTAFTFINVEGSTIVADEHVTFTCKTGNFLGKNLILDMDSVRIDCKGTIDIRNAKITTPGNTTIIGGTSTSCPNSAEPWSTCPAPRSPPTPAHHGQRWQRPPRGLLRDLQHHGRGLPDVQQQSGPAIHQQHQGHHRGVQSGCGRHRLQRERMRATVSPADRRREVLTASRPSRLFAGTDGLSDDGIWLPQTCGVTLKVTSSDRGVGNVGASLRLNLDVDRERGGW
jgi:hypothetical protein